MSMLYEVSQNVKLGGKFFGSSNNVSAEAEMVRELSLSAALAGTLSTRMGDADGTITLSEDHGLEEGDRIDIYFSSGSQRSSFVDSVSYGDVVVTGGIGDALPDLEDAVVRVSLADNETAVIVGDDVVGIAAYCAADANFVFTDGEGELFHVTLKNGVTSFQWFDGCGLDNPIAGLNISEVWLSQGDSTKSQLIRYGFLYN